MIGQTLPSLAKYSAGFIVLSRTFGVFSGTVQASKRAISFLDSIPKSEGFGAWSKKTKAQRARDSVVAQAKNTPVVDGTIQLGAVKKPSKASVSGRPVPSPFIEARNKIKNLTYETNLLASKADIISPDPYVPSGRKKPRLGLSHFRDLASGKVQRSSRKRGGDAGNTDLETLVSMATFGIVSPTSKRAVGKVGGGIGKAFKALGSPLRLLTGGFKALFTLVKANPIVAVLTTVGSLLSAAWFGSEKFRNAVGGLGDKIGKLGGFLASTFGPVFEWLGQKFSEFGAWLGDGLAVAIDWASTKLGEFTGWLQGTVLPWWQGTAWPAISQAIQAASEAIGPVWEMVKGWFSSFWDWMMGTAVPWWTGTAWPVIMTAVQAAGQVISPVINAVMAVMGALWNWVSGTFLPWWQGTAWPAISLAVSQAGAIVNPIITTIQNTITNIKTGFEVGKAVMIQFWDSLKEKVLSVWNRIQEPLNLIRSGMDTIGAAGSSAWGTVTGWFGGGRASGGPVLPGVAYRVGELGPETFVPTSPGMIIPHRPTAKLAAVGPGGVRRDAPLVHIGQITVQSGRDLVSEAQVRKLGRAIAAEVDRRVLIDRQVG